MLILVFVCCYYMPQEVNQNLIKQVYHRDFSWKLCWKIATDCVVFGITTKPCILNAIASLSLII